MWQAAKQLLWGRNVTGFVGRLFGAISVMSLIEYAFGYNFGEAINNIVVVFNELLKLFPGSLEPPVEALIAWIRTKLPWDLTLHDHWKHVVMLVGLYLSRSVLISFQVGWYNGVYRSLAAFIVAILSGVATGVIAVTETEFWPNFLIAASPVIGLLVYGVANGLYASRFLMKIETERRPELTTRRSVIWGHSKAAVVRTIVALAILFFGLQLPQIAGVPSPGLLMLTVLVTVSAARHMHEGMVQAKIEVEGERQWQDVYWEMNSTYIGMSMLAVLAWGLLLLFADLILSSIGF